MKILGVEFDVVGNSYRLIVGDIVIVVYYDQFHTVENYMYICDISLPNGVFLEDYADSKEDALMLCLKQYLNIGGRNEAVLEKIKCIEDNYTIKDILE